jgi:hypothetical protein
MKLTNLIKNEKYFESWDDQTNKNEETDNDNY